MIGLQSSLIILVFVMMVFVFVVAMIIAQQITKEHRQVEKRIDEIQGVHKEEEIKDDKSSSGFHRSIKTIIMNQSWTSKIADAIAEELLKGNILMKPEEFAIMWVALTTIPALLTLLFVPNPVIPPILAGAGALLPIVYVKNAQSKRLKGFDAQLSDALIICSNCMKSGLSFSQAMETIAKEMEDPIGTEFRRAVNEMSYGTSQDEALENMQKRVKSADFLMTVAAVNVQKQTGGNLSEILDIISETIRDRMKIKAEIKGITAQGRLSGIIIGALPVVVALLVSIMNPSYMTVFFTTNSGRIMLAVCVCMEAAGFFLINKIVTIKY